MLFKDYIILNSLQNFIDLYYEIHDQVFFVKIIRLKIK